MEKHPVTAVIVGGGHRSFIYADYSLTHPEDLKIAGIADPNRERCIIAARKYGFSEEFCFESAEELAKQPKLADAVINGTMDHQHFMTAAPLLCHGSFSQAACLFCKRPNLPIYRGHKTLRGGGSLRFQRFECS